MLRARWSRGVVVWLGPISWGPWRAMTAIKLQKHKPDEGRRRKDGQNWVEGKMNSRRVFIVLRNMRRFAVAKDSSQWRRTLRSGEKCLRSGVDTLAVAYPKVGKGLHSDVGCYAVVDQKVRPQKSVPDPSVVVLASFGIQYLGYLPRSAMFNVFSLTFLQRTTFKA